MFVFILIFLLLILLFELFLDTSSCILTPVFVIEWFCLLLRKCEHALEQILDGSLTCSVLESRGEHPHSTEAIQLVLFL